MPNTKKVDQHISMGKPSSSTPATRASSRMANAAFPFSTDRGCAWRPRAVEVDAVENPDSRGQARRAARTKKRSADVSPKSATAKKARIAVLSLAAKETAAVAVTMPPSPPLRPTVCKQRTFGMRSLAGVSSPGGLGEEEEEKKAGEKEEEEEEEEKWKRWENDDDDEEEEIEEGVEILWTRDEDERRSDEGDGESSLSERVSAWLLRAGIQMSPTERNGTTTEEPGSKPKETQGTAGNVEAPSPAVGQNTGLASDTQKDAADRVDYAKQVLDDALWDEGNKRQRWKSTRIAALAAGDSSNKATVKAENLVAALEASWQQSVEPAAFKVDQLTQKWHRRYHHMLKMEPNVRESADAAQQADQALSLAEGTVARAKSAYKAALTRLQLPFLDCNYDNLLAAKKRAFTELKLARKNVEAARAKAAKAHEDSERVACLVDVEVVERFLLSRRINAAFDRYVAVKGPHDELDLEVKAAKVAEEAAKAEEQAAKARSIKPYQEYQEALNRTQWARKNLRNASRVGEDSGISSGSRIDSSGGTGGSGGAEAPILDKKLGGVKRDAVAMEDLESQAKGFEKDHGRKRRRRLDVAVA